MQYFNSTAIAAASYNPSTKTLTLWFRSGGQGYDFFGVPAQIYQSFLVAPSKGQFYHAYIRDQYAA